MRINIVMNHKGNFFILMHFNFASDDTMLNKKQVL